MDGYINQIPWAPDSIIFVLGAATSTPRRAWIGLVLFSRVYYVWYNREAILRCSEAAGYHLGRRKKVQCVMFDAAF